MGKIDGLAKSRKMPFLVIPAKDGIQFYQLLLEPRPEIIPH